MTHTRTWLRQLQDSKAIRRLREQPGRVGEPIGPTLLGSDTACKNCGYLSCDCSHMDKMSADLPPAEGKVLLRCRNAANKIGDYANGVVLSRSGSLTELAVSSVFYDKNRMGGSVTLAFEDQDCRYYSVHLSKRDLGRKYTSGHPHPDGEEDDSNSLALYLAYRVTKDRLLCNLHAAVAARLLPCPDSINNLPREAQVNWKRDWKQMVVDRNSGLDQILTAYSALTTEAVDLPE